MRIFLPFLLFLLAAQALPVAAQPPEIAHFTATPKTVSIGEPVTLNWDIRHADQVYILNQGKVHSLSGTQTFSPEQDTVLTLLAENRFGISSANLTVRVKGGRGKAEFPAEKDFRGQRQYTLSGQPLVDLLDVVHHLLQNYLDFQIQEVYDRRGKITSFTTAHSGKPKDQELAGLLQPDKQGKQRRIAFLVRLHKEDQARRYSCTIEACIEYKLRSSNKWRAEAQDSPVYGKGITRLHGLLAEGL